VDVKARSGQPEKSKQGGKEDGKAAGKYIGKLAGTEKDLDLEQGCKGC
jgi:hypothetical protein